MDFLHIYCRSLSTVTHLFYYQHDSIYSSTHISLAPSWLVHHPRSIPSIPLASEKDSVVESPLNREVEESHFVRFVMIQRVIKWGTYWPLTLKYTSKLQLLFLLH